MDRSRNRLKTGDRVIVIGYVHDSTGEFEPHGTVEYLYPRKDGVHIRLDRGGDCFPDPYQVIHEPVTPTVVV